MNNETVRKLSIASIFFAIFSTVIIAAWNVEQSESVQDTSETRQSMESNQ